MKNIRTHMQLTKQQGNVLLMCLALILIMTLWGISSTRNTVLSLQANNNAKLKQISFEAAEFALRQVEQRLSDQVTLAEQIPNLFNGTNGLYSLALDIRQGVDLAMLPVEFDFKKANDWLENYTPDGFFRGLSFIEVDYLSDPAEANYLERQPRAVVEYIGRTEYDDDNGNANGRYVFRISVIAWGPHGEASSVVRTHYALNL